MVSSTRLSEVKNGLTPLVERAEGPLQRPSERRHINRLPLGLLLLLTILATQAGLAIRLMRSNTAFLDEATYLVAGHQLIHAWLHGGPNLHYGYYFSGAPFLYPVVGAAADSLGGLFAARLLSLAFMLATTFLVYASGRRLYGQAAALFAAALFVTVSATQFLGAFATYDAMALMLVTLAFWVVVRATTRPDHDRGWDHGLAPTFTGVYLAAPILVLANLTKYASVAFTPIVVGAALCLVASQSTWRQGIRVAVVLSASMAALLGLTFAVIGGDYLHGLMSTTLARSHGTASPGNLLGHSAEWVGAVAAFALVSSVVEAVRAKRGQSGWAHVVLAAVLAAAVVIAPLAQLRIATTTSLSKHVGFGAMFGAVVVGGLFATAAANRRRAVPGFLVGCITIGVLGVAGVHQSRQLFQQWTNSAGLVAVIKPLVTGTIRPVLADDASVLSYYLDGRIHPTRWYDTFDMSYSSSTTNGRLVGSPAYRRAITDGYFEVVALRLDSQYAGDVAALASLRADPAYHLLTRVQTRDRFGTSTYRIWIYEGAH